MATSTLSLTQLLSSEFKFSAALRPQRPYGLLGTGSPGRPPRLSHSSSALTMRSSSMLLYAQRRERILGPRTATSAFTQLLNSESSQFEFTVALRPQRPYGLLGTGNQDGHLDSHTVPELGVDVVPPVTEDLRAILFVYVGADGSRVMTQHSCVHSVSLCSSVSQL